MPEYELVCGLEVHTELATKSKIFCSCTTAFGGEPNTHVCEICSGMPGTLPVLNGPMELDGVALAPAQVDRLGPNLLSFRIHEGKNRQIRRMCQQVGLTVKALRRVREGQVQLGGLKLGKWRYLTEEEVALLKAL